MTIKSRLCDLAIFGAPPAFSDKLHVGRPNIGSKERLLERISSILESRWLSNDGPSVQELEHVLAKFLGVRHCVATCNATVALEIVIRALGLEGEVIVPSFTFIATAHALQWQGITPVFCDVAPRTHTLDPQQVERLITPRTSGIVGVHLWGRPCEIEGLTEIARQHRLKLLFDAAHAFACTHRGQMIGNFGAAEVFSLHATKFFTSAEGGVIATNDDKLAAKVKLMRNFGFAGFDNVVEVGTNGKMSEMSAAMGLVSFESLDEFIAANRRNYLRYRTEFENLPGIQLISYDERESNNYQYVVVEVDETLTRIARDEMLEVLLAENIIARRYFYPGCHRMEPYRSLYPSAGMTLPATEELSRRVLVLPTGPALSSNDVATICRIIRTVVSLSSEIHHSRSSNQRLHSRP
jgi:dTDP-4-amino-4,6-dideoxygalactose transaminase